MNIPIFRALLRNAADVVQSRQWARTVAGALDISEQNQTRIATAVSEIARNAVTYAGGGRIEFTVGKAAGRPALLIEITDKGRGIPDIDAVLEGRYVSPTGLGLGIPGARRLMDDFTLSTGESGTRITMAKWVGAQEVPPSRFQAQAQQAAARLARIRQLDPVAVAQQQNRELLESLHQLRVNEEQLLAANERLRSSLREKEVLLREVHHRVKNNLQIVSSLVSLQGARSHSPEAKRELSALSGRIRSLSLIHDHLYHGESVARIELGQYVADLCNRIRDVFAEPDARIELSYDMPEVVIPIDLAINIGLVINELVTNSYKHAFPNGKKGLISVEGSLQGGRLALIVADDGVGSTAAQSGAKGRTLGTTLVETMIGRLHGTIDVDCTAGTRNTIELDLSAFTDGTAT